MRFWISISRSVAAASIPDSQSQVRHCRSLGRVTSRKSANVRRIGSRRKSRCSAVGTKCLPFRRKRFHSEHRRKFNTERCTRCRVASFYYPRSLATSLHPFSFCLFSLRLTNHPRVARGIPVLVHDSVSTSGLSSALAPGARSRDVWTRRDGWEKRVCVACPRSWRDCEHTATCLRRLARQSPQSNDDSLAFRPVPIHRDQDNVYCTTASIGQSSFDAFRRANGAIER